MNNDDITLCSLDIGKKGKVKSIMIDGLMKRRLLDLGLIDNTLIEALYKSPFGDPVAYFIRGTVIALREDIASKILIEKI
jgi:ferrous iron transport protein A